MAHGKNAEKAGRPGVEYWSPRPFSFWGVGRWVKTMCHRAERREARVEIEEQLTEMGGLGGTDIPATDG